MEVTVTLKTAGAVFLRMTVWNGDGDKAIVPNAKLAGVADKGLGAWLYARSGNASNDKANIFNNILQLFTIRLLMLFRFRDKPGPYFKLHGTGQ